MNKRKDYVQVAGMLRKKAIEFPDERHELARTIVMTSILRQQAATPSRRCRRALMPA
ncbi:MULTISPECIES: hypothetical protein [unclassified Bradyrhizobium]|uniref:hypothetical protein n=1 Tax=unclassified Bradyrhizobium TaxID=2631580 RepID=UPI002302A89E|nr:hypothetical protein [Bradyrhizobium sp. CCBAU 45321]